MRGFRRRLRAAWRPIARGAGKGPTPADEAELIDLWEAIPEDERPLALDILRPLAKRKKSTGKRGGS